MTIAGSSCGVSPTAIASLECRLRLPLAEPQRDRPEGGAATGLHDHAEAAAATHDRAHEHTGGEVERRLGRRVRLESFLCRERLACQHRFVALQALRLQQPQVGGDDVADLDPDDIARHQLGHVDPFGLPVAQGKGRVPQLRMERLDRALGAVLIEEAEPDAQAADQKDDERIEPLADEE